MFIVPDNTLEQLICDFCHKYLSVKPVRNAYIDNVKKICGRCSPHALCPSNGSQQEIVVSHLYEFLSEYMLFKCINRFAGCDKILTSDEVLIHEKHCHGKSFFCFICKFNSMINAGMPEPHAVDGFEILQHLKTKHQESQANSIIRTNLKALEKWNTFYYIMDDYIFIIFVKFKRRDQVFLFKVYYIGGGSGNKLFEVNGNITIDSQKVTHNLQFGSRRLRNVEAVVKIGHLLLDDAPVNMQLDCSFSHAFQLQQNPNFKGVENYRKLRHLKIEQTPPVAINLNSTKTKLIITLNDEEIELNVECILCHGISSDNIFITINGKYRNLLCSRCVYIYKAPYEYFEKFYNFNVMNYLSFSCIWDCGEFLFDKIADPIKIVDPIVSATSTCTSTTTTRNTCSSNQSNLSFTAQWTNHRMHTVLGSNTSNLYPYPSNQSNQRTAFGVSTTSNLCSSNQSNQSNVNSINQPNQSSSRHNNQHNQSSETRQIITYHEIFSCKNVPQQKCPVQNCYFIGTFAYIKKHLLGLHNVDLIFENYATIKKDSVIKMKLHESRTFHIIIPQAYVNGNIEICDDTPNIKKFTIEIFLNHLCQDYSSITAVVCNGTHCDKFLTSFSTKCTFSVSDLPIRLQIVPHLLKLSL